MQTLLVLYMVGQLLHAALVGGATVAMLVGWRMFAHLLAPTGPGLERVPA
jgi:hypothetical protein